MVGNHSPASLVLRPTATLALIGTLCAGPGARAADAPGKLALNPERVAVFKDGYALVVKRARGMADSAGTVHTLEVPDAAVLGTFWVLADGGAPVIARAEFVADEPKEGPCLSVLDLVRANIGKHVTLDGNRRVTGTIVAVLEPDAAPVINPDHSNRWSHPAHAHPGVPFIVMQTTAQERIIFPASDIQSITGPDLATTTLPKGPAPKQKRLAFDLGNSAAGKPATLTLFYFTPGVRWIPEYRLEGVGGQKADMFLQGEIVNDLEDFRGATFDLVAGVPNFKFKDAVSPLTLEAAIRQVAAQTEQLRSLMSQRLSNVAYNEGRREDETASPPIPGDITASPEQDLFVYPMGVLNLAKGSRAAVPIWSSRPAVRHIYTLDIRPLKGDHGIALYGSSDPGSPATVSDAGPEVFRVWHQLELTNPGPSPWTTGPAMVMQDGLPISQDILRYVPANGVGRLALTVALDVRGTFREEEIERIPDATRIDRRAYTKVRKRATVTLKNQRSEASSVCTTVSIAGAAANPSHNGTVTIDSWRPQDRELGIEPRANNHSDLKWEVKLDPGQTVELTFEYTVML